MINGVLEENHFASTVEEVNEITPLGVDSNSNDVSVRPANFTWGLIPTSLHVENGILITDLNGFVEDKTAPRSVALPSGERASGSPKLSGVPANSYDLSLSVNEAFINRMIQLSFNRGYFSETQPKNEYTLTEAPYFQLDSSLKPKTTKLHVSISQVYHPQSSLEKIEGTLAIHNPIRVSFDLINRTQINTKENTLAMIEDHIDLDSVKLDPNSVRAGIFYNKVLAAVKEQLTALNEQMAAKETPVAPAFDLPSGLLGVPLKIKDIEADSGGHFNVFVEVKQ
jgi:hypothetical protein